MNKAQVKIVNTATGEEIARDANAEELAQMEKDAATWAAELLAKAEAEAKKAAAEAKLAALGLTSDDLKALGLQHNLYR